jgi:hypothetical protein
MFPDCAVPQMYTMIPTVSHIAINNYDGVCPVLQIQWLLYSAEQKNWPLVLINHAFLKKHMHRAKKTSLLQIA